MSIADWLEQHSLPCFYRHYLGVDCPGCGFQRSAIELLRGNVWNSIHIYPALLPSLLLVLVLMLHLKFKFRHGAKMLIALFIFNTVIMVGFYIYRMAA